MTLVHVHNVIEVLVNYTIFLLPLLLLSSKNRINLNMKTEQEVGIITVWEDTIDIP